MNKYLLILLPFLPLLTIAQPKVKKLTPKNTPSEVTYVGDLMQAIQWKDSVGDNIVVLSETPKAQNATRPEKDYYEAALDARHFVFINDHWVAKWSTHDQVNECNLALAANFVENSFHITDLDEDGIVEVWLLYRVGCHHMERPSYMKLIMYESETRYSMKGLSDANTDERKGDYSLDASFTKGPAIFKEYALELWDENLTNEGRRYRPRSSR